MNDFDKQLAGPCCSLIQTYATYIYIYNLQMYIHIYIYMSIYTYMHIELYLYMVGGFNHLEKYEINGKDYSIPYNTKK